MLTYSKSTKRVRRMPMHLSSGHVTLMPGKFSPLFTPPNFPQSDLGRRADSRWALPEISSFFLLRGHWLFCNVNLHFLASFSPNNLTIFFVSILVLGHSYSSIKLYWNSFTGVPENAKQRVYCGRESTTYSLRTCSGGILHGRQSQSRPSADLCRYWATTTATGWRQLQPSGRQRTRLLFQVFTWILYS